jgi:peptidoglycan/LPS O-acetylase OafA/YrhL
VTWSYRPALDGARTLAVYLVVLFHAGLSWADGGFIGVDLFFVLSGFLVSTILYGELADRGHLDLVRFYDRRVRRLLPAAVVLVVVVSLVGVLVLSAADRGPMAGDARAALLYYANWHFMAQSNDYFGSTVVDSSLFLHFWSLSIEEQFYFLFPVLLLVLHRVDRRWRHATPVVLSALLVASVALQRWWAPQDANHAYYGTETRFYQLLAGVLLALWLHRRRAAGRQGMPGAVPATLAGAVIVVVLAGSWLDLSPSWRGLASTVGALLLVGGLSGEQVHVAARPFTFPPVVYLGKISYGTYLWHWPIIVLLGQAIDPPAWQFALLVVALSTAVAAASYTMLETPIRSRRLAPSRRLPAVLAGLAASLVTALLVVPPVMAATQPVALKGNGLLESGPDNTTGPPPELDYARLTSYREAPVRECRPRDLDP